jgi:hypothetical protein
MAYLCNVADGVSCSSVTHQCTMLRTTGQSCGQDLDCVAGDYCKFAPAGSACTARIADGASCAGSPSSACLTASYCDQGSQTCKPLLLGGSACTLDAQCQRHTCINGACGFGSDLSLFCAR